MGSDLLHSHPAGEASSPQASTETVASVRVFKGLDALSGWGDPTRWLQNARRSKGQTFDALQRVRALDALGSGDLLEASGSMPCVLCRAPLSRDQRQLGPFIWGVDAVHYLTAHQIWPPELDWLIGTYESTCRSS